MPCRTAAALAVLIVALIAAAPVRAQTCGTPPDPRSNTAGYASWCSCMGGSYNYQTTACTGARGPRTGGGQTASDNWGCFAQARNGGTGNSWGFASESEARQRALSECRGRGGSSCTVRYCQRGTSAGNAPGRQRTAPPPQTTTEGVVDTGNWGCWAQASNGRGGYSWGFTSEGEARQRALSECRAHSGQTSCTVRACQPGTSAQLLPSKRPVAGTARRQVQDAPSSSAEPAPSPAPQEAPRYLCAVCERKLDADLRTGLSSARPRSFVQQVLAGYENCKLKAWPPCFLGDIQARSVTNACSGFTGNTEFKACLGRVLGQ